MIPHISCSDREKGGFLNSKFHIKYWKSFHTQSLHDYIVIYVLQRKEKQSKMYVIILYILFNDDIFICCVHGNFWCKIIVSAQAQSDGMLLNWKRDFQILSRNCDSISRPTKSTSIIPKYYFDLIYKWKKACQFKLNACMV